MPLTQDKVTYATGANRNSDTDKLDYSGFLSEYALPYYASYMHRNRFMEDGTIRDSDNWKAGIPLERYMSSLFRHFISAWTAHKGAPSEQYIEDALCGVIFNAFGYLHERLKQDNETTYELTEEGKKLYEGFFKDDEDSREKRHPLENDVTQLEEPTKITQPIYYTNEPKLENYTTKEKLLSLLHLK